MTYRATVLADTPDAYWRLGESSGTSAADETGNGKTGTYVGAPTLGAASLLTGDADTAVTFNGTTQDVSLPTDVVSIPTATSACSIEAWFKTTSAGASIPIVSARSGGATKIIDLFLNGGLILLQARGNSGEGLLQLQTGSFFHDGVRHHVIVCRDTSKTWRIYVDGVLATRGADGITTAVTGLTTTCIAKQSDSPTFFNGTVDEVAVYSYALSAAQARDHYTAGSQEATTTDGDAYSSVILSDGPTTYYRLGEAAGIRAVDASGGGMHGARRDGAGVNNPGLLGTAYSNPGSILDGTNDWIDTGEDVMKILSATDDLTIEAWVKTSAGGANSIFAARRAGNASPAIFFDTSGNALRVVGRNNDGSNLFVSGGTTVINNGATHHVVATRRGSDKKWRFYTDGVNDGTSAADGLSLISGLSLSTIGCDQLSPTFYNGTVDEVAFYYGKELTAAQILAHYNAGKYRLPRHPAINHQDPGIL